VLIHAAILSKFASRANLTWTGDLALDDTAVINYSVTTNSSDPTPGR
jgi:hypothetical protein